MNKKGIFSIAFILVMLVLIPFGVALEVEADPFVLIGIVPPYSQTKPPNVTILEPENYTSYNSNQLWLYLNTTIENIYPAQGTWVGEIWYKADWETNYTVVYNHNEIWNGSISRYCPLNNIPEGNHSVTVIAQGEGNYYAFPETGSTSLYSFFINGSSTVFFTVDTSPSPSPSPSPTPTTSPIITPTLEPTIEPTSTPKQQTGFLGTNLPVEYGYAIVAVLVIVIVAGLSLVYFKKVRKN
jgi:hypothetical protein